MREQSWRPVSPSWQARYTHGPGIDEPIAVTKGGSTFFYHQDGLGSVTDLTDSSGATAKSYAYDSYGTILESPGAVDQPYTYTGREFNSESGLYYYRARNYDPATGRFLQKDPIGLDSGPNVYLYVGSNPSNWGDATGLSRDKYVPDAKKHGGPHVDRYTKDGQHVGRYQPDGKPIPHKGQTPSPVPNSDLDKFKKAASKATKAGGIIGAIIGGLLDPGEANAGEDDLLRERNKLLPEDFDSNEMLICK